MTFSRKTFCQIDLKALRHNVSQLKKLNGNASFFCPMVKADAYGHGAVEVSKELVRQGVSQLGVALVEEAKQLRAAGITEPRIYVFGTFAPSDIQTFLELNLTPVIHNWEQLNWLAQANSKFALRVHLKFNTGMNRLGFEPSESEKLSAFFQKYDHVTVEGLCSHLATSEDALQNVGQTQKQIQTFQKIVAGFNRPDLILHLYNSGGVLAKALKGLPAWGSRPGIALYGFKPQYNILDPHSQKAMETNLEPWTFHPLMTFQSEIISQHHVNPGEGVSYGARWTSDRESLIASVAAGYADGVARSLSNKGSFLFRDQRVPIRGTVCMDYTMVDLTLASGIETKGASIGDVITLFDGGEKPKLSAQEWAEAAQTNVYEIVTRIGSRVPRVYV